MNAENQNKHQHMYDGSGMSTSQNYQQQGLCFFSFLIGLWMQSTAQHPYNILVIDMPKSDKNNSNSNNNSTKENIGIKYGLS